jgi:hypothetical protein
MPMRNLAIALCALAGTALAEEAASGLAAPAPPWSTDVAATRKAALEKGEPCVLLLHLDSKAL